MFFVLILQYIPQNINSLTVSFYVFVENNPNNPNENADNDLEDEFGKILTIFFVNVSTFLKVCSVSLSFAATFLYVMENVWNEL